jgi:4-aminobutyrate aminotransferase-like enzyme/Ser/Thr protein kinase RdoA (MazF antagonist)
MFLEESMRLALSEAEAERLALELYGIRTAASALPGEYDSNFHLRASEGREFVLKCMHPAREAGFIDLQCAALRHLAAHAGGLPLPRVQLNREGRPVAEILDAARQKRLVWMLSYLPGTTLEKTHPHSEELLADLGRFLGEVDRALSTFSHPSARRELKWDSSRARWIEGQLHHLVDPERRAVVDRFLALYRERVEPLGSALRAGTIYGDANDHNVLVGSASAEPRPIAGLIDFGDMHHGWIASEPAIAAAYVVLGKNDPLAQICSIVRGFHRAYPLEEAEIEVLFPLVAARLAVSVVNSARLKEQKPEDPYVTVTEAPAWEALQRLSRIHPRFAHYALREACGLAPVAASSRVSAWLLEQAKSAPGVLARDLGREPFEIFDLGAGSTLLGADPAAGEAHALSRTLFESMERANVTIGVGRYNEARLLYTAPQYGPGEGEERRTVHLGLDLFVEPGTDVLAPLDGVVQLVAENTAHLDFGPLAILRHGTPDGVEFFTLYGHLASATLRELEPGRAIRKGEAFARVGTLLENGHWPPHLHFQLIVDLLDRGAEFPGVARASERAVWTSLCPDPAVLLGLPAEVSRPEPSAEETLARRRELLGANLSVSYRQPLKIVRGWRQYLYDHNGRAYLDVYNNVPLVGHSHPRVVRAAREQLALLNTNTRYLHENVLRYAERLTRLLPDPLRVCYVVNSGSEANELALRLARAHTRSEEVIVLEHAYHGHTGTLIDISPYKFNGPGGAGPKGWVHVAPLADDFRGVYRRGEPDLGPRYAARVGEISRALASEGKRATFIAETLPSVAGQIVFPEGYLREVYRQVRSAGGVCIADEVQVGFGRLGTHFWGFETQGVVPDIAVFGKPIGNAFPLAAVVTTREIAASFDNGMEFFSTFGGNPVSAAVGLAVLEVVEEEKLQQNALCTGKAWIDELRGLARAHPLVGDVRGSGLFLGLDLVRSEAKREPATRQASYVVNRLREEGILAGTDGPDHNVIKLRPPLIFSDRDAHRFCAVLDRVLREDPARP